MSIFLFFPKGITNGKKKQKKTLSRKNNVWNGKKYVWNMAPESAKRVNHPAPFPEELPYRLIQLYSFNEDIILDPFMRSGTTALAALKSNRTYLGYDINEEYIRIAQDRITSFLG